MKIKNTILTIDKFKLHHKVSKRIADTFWERFQTKLFAAVTVLKVINLLCVKTAWKDNKISFFLTS